MANGLVSSSLQPRLWPVASFRQSIARLLVGGKATSALILIEVFVAHGDSSFSTCRSKAGLFAIAARFNRRCHPSQNVHYVIDEQHGCLGKTMSADKVDAGEESDTRGSVFVVRISLPMWLL